MGGEGGARAEGGLGAQMGRADPGVGAEEAEQRKEKGGRDKETGKREGKKEGTWEFRTLGRRRKRKKKD